MRIAEVCGAYEFGAHILQESDTLILLNEYAQHQSARNVVDLLVVDVVSTRCQVVHF